MRRVAIIPARGGSKRLPRKNIRPFFGKPIIHYAIAAAKASKIFDDVMVSTDDEEVATAAMLGGCATVIKRPAELADDHVGTGAVMRHAIQYLVDNGAAIEQACCIYPCTPLIHPLDLHEGFHLMMVSDYAYCFPVARYAPAVQRMLRMDDLGVLKSVWPNFDEVRTQDLDERWHDAGQWYWGKAHAWLNELQPYAGVAVGLPIPRWRAIDIDTLDDWRVAEAVFAAQHNEGRA